MIDAYEVRTRVAADAESITCKLLGEANRKLSNRRELRWGNHGSFVLDLVTGKWRDWETGEHGDMADLVVREIGGDQRSAFRWLCRWLGIELGKLEEPDPVRLKQREAESLQREMQAHDAKERGLRRAEFILSWGMPLIGSLAERYLTEHRLGGAPVPAAVMETGSLKFHPAPYGPNEPVVLDARGWPAVGALLARMVDPATGEFAGVHRTFLDHDGRKITKKVLGGSGIIKLDDRTPGPLAIAEGIETAMHIMTAIGWKGPFWATANAGNMKKLPVLDGAESIAIFADNDRRDSRGKRPGNNAAMTCADRWKDCGCKATVMKPPVEGMDWDDYLVSLRRGSGQYYG